jgi:hypothetical protein
VRAGTPGQHGGHLIGGSIDELHHDPAGREGGALTERRQAVKGRHVDRQRFAGQQPLLGVQRGVEGGNLRARHGSQTDHRHANDQPEGGKSRRVTGSRHRSCLLVERTA